MGRPSFAPIELPSRGMFPDAAPEALERGYAQSITDFLVNRPGKLVPRGPINLLESMATPVTANGRLFGGRGWVFGDKAAFAAHDIAGSAVGRQYWVAPHRPAAAVGDLALHKNWGSVANPTTWIYDAATDTVSTVVHGAATDAKLLAPGLRGVNHLGKVWGPGYAGAGSFVAGASGTHYARVLLSWDGAATWAAGGVGNEYPMDVASHYERLFVLGINLPGGAFGWNTLYFTNPGADPAVSANWQTSGVTNSISVGPSETTDSGVALAQVGGDLLVLKRRSIWILKGYSTDTFQVKRVTSELGCVDPRSVVETETAVYFMSQRGFMRYDGAELVNTSRAINNAQLLSEVHRLVGDSGLDGGFVEAAALPNGFILVSVGQHTPITAGAADSRPLQYLFDTADGAWVRISASAPTTATAPHSVVRTPRFWLGLGGQSIHDMQYVTQPELAVAAGKSLLVDDQAVDARYAPTWTSRVIRLGMPEARSQLLQTLLETLVTYTGTQFQPFTYRPYLAFTGTAMALTTIPVPTSGARQRDLTRYGDEVDDVYFVVAADGAFTIANTQYQAVEIRSLAVESSVAMEKV